MQVFTSPEPRQVPHLRLIRDEESPPYDVGATDAELPTVTPEPSADIRRAVLDRHGWQTAGFFGALLAMEDDGIPITYQIVEDHLRVSRSVVMRMMRKLVEVGAVTIERTKGGRGQESTINCVYNRVPTDTVIPETVSKTVSETVSASLSHSLFNTPSSYDEKKRETPTPFCRCEIDAVLSSLADLPRMVDAATFHRLGHEAVYALGWEGISEFPVKDAVDDGDCFIDLVAEKDGCRIAVEFDRTTARRKSVEKLQLVEGATRIVVLRTGKVGATEDGVDHVVVAQGQGDVPNRPTKPLPQNGPAQQIVAAFCKAAGIEKPAIYQRAVGQAAMLVKAGITPDDVPSLYEYTCGWTKDRTASLGAMLSSVDEWRQKKNAPPAQQNGSAPVLDLESAEEVVNARRWVERKMAEAREYNGEHIPAATKFECDQALNRARQAAMQRLAVR